MSELNISHLGIDKEITLTNEYSSQYNAGLGDGRRGTLNHRDNHWQGYHGVNFEATIDLGALTPINEISCSFLQKHSAWIFLPTEVHFQLSKNGNDFFSIKKFKEETIADPSYKVKDYVSTFSQREARFVKVNAKNIGICPEWHPGSGNRGWLFVDEIVIN